MVNQYANENGKASCFTFEQMLQSLRSINPFYSLQIIKHSDGILPIQVSLQIEQGNNFCTKRDLLDEYTPEERHKEYEYRKNIIEWVIIDANHGGYDKYIALLYGKHPQIGIC
jgi:hypothetical protein